MEGDVAASGELRSGVEADWLETARNRRVTRSPALIWLLLLTALGLSVASLLAESAGSSSALEVTMLATAVAATVVLISAGTLALHGSRESRWDAPLTVGLGSVMLGIGVFEQVLAASAAIHDVEPLSGVAHALGFFRWVGLCLITGGLVWRAETGWSERHRTRLISLVLAAPVVAATAWVTAGDSYTVPERAVLLLLTGLLVVTSLRLLRRDNTAPFLEGGTVLGVGLALAIIQDVASLEPGDVASVAALVWLVVAGLLTTLWFDRQAALRTQEHRSQTQRYLRLIEDSRHTLEQAMNDRSVLRHNSTSSLVAIEGALDALGSSLEIGDAEGHERMTRALAGEIGRLRRMLASVEVDGQQPETTLIEAVDSVVQLARIRGQLVVVNVPEDLVVAARPDAVAEIVHNLLDNAAIHAPGAVVAVEASVADDGAVQLIVQDDGPGVRSDLQPRLFDKGVSQRKGDHTGLGLYSARQLAVEAGGDLCLLPSSEGAVFCVELPAASQPGRVIDLRAVADQRDEAAQ